MGEYFVLQIQVDLCLLGNGPSKYLLLEGLDPSQAWDLPATLVLGRRRQEDHWELEAKLDFLIPGQFEIRVVEILMLKNKTKQRTKAKIKPKPNKVRTEPTHCCRLNQWFSSVFSKLLESTGDEAPRCRDRLTLADCVKEILCHSPVSRCCSLSLDSQRSVCWSFDWQPVVLLEDGATCGRVGLVEGSQVVGTVTLKPQPTPFLPFLSSISLLFIFCFSSFLPLSFSFFSSLPSLLTTTVTNSSSCIPQQDARPHCRPTGRGPLRLPGKLLFPTFNLIFSQHWKLNKEHKTMVHHLSDDCNEIEHFQASLLLVRNLGFF